MPQTHQPHPIAVFRFLRGWSQRDLAAAASLSPDTIYRLERGDEPTLRTAQAIARVLGTSVDEAFPQNDESAPATGAPRHNLTQRLSPAGNVVTG